MVVSIDALLSRSDTSRVAGTAKASNDSHDAVSCNS